MNQSSNEDHAQLPSNSSDDALPGDVLHNTSKAGEALPGGLQDAFGMDRQYIDRRSRDVFRFLSNRYWRIETRGLEHLPRSGPAVLVGAHRGFVPWDAIMTVHLILRETGRVPRFLVHPGLMKFSPIARFVKKMGGVLACRENAGRVLENEEILGVFPEGVQGAFTPLRKAYQLQSFGRNTFVRLAARYRAPIIPFVTVGSAEVFPIFTTVNSRAWKRYAKWPCIPISTFPLFPLPLPVKWRMQFLPAITVENQFSAAPEVNYSEISCIASEVKATMQRAIDELLEKRRSLFF